MNNQAINPLAHLNEDSSLKKINDAFRPFDSMISLRYFGEYAENSLFLGAEKSCQWKIVKDSQGCWCLVPKTLKKQLKTI
jgi:hypothetical protein